MFYTLYYISKWDKKNCPQKVQLDFDAVLKKVVELLYVKFYVIFAPRRQIIKRKKQDKR